MENNKKKSECNTCKQKSPVSFQTWSIILGFYVLFSSVYGTIEIGKSIISWIKSSFGI
jgi:hypothetical protein